MKPWWFALVLAVLTLSFRPARAGWGTTRWGMTPREVAAAARAAGETPSTRAGHVCPLRWDDLSPQGLVRTSASWNGRTYQLRYHFDPDGLRLVALYHVAAGAAESDQVAAVCAVHRADFTKTLGAPTRVRERDVEIFEWNDATAGQVVRVAATPKACVLWFADPAFARAGYPQRREPLQCAAAVAPGPGRTERLGAATACVSDDDQYFVSRTLTIEHPTDVVVRVTSDAPAAVILSAFPDRGADPVERDGALAEQAAAGSTWTAELRGELAPGCYEIQVGAVDAHRELTVSLAVETPRARALEDFERLRREKEELERGIGARHADGDGDGDGDADGDGDGDGDDDDGDGDGDGDGPTLGELAARGSEVESFAAFLGAGAGGEAGTLPARHEVAGDRGRRLLGETALTMAFPAPGHMYGVGASLGVALNPRSRLRAEVGGAAAFYLQPVDVPRSTVNLMVPLAAWAGARLQLTRRLAVTARAGVLGYYSTDDMIVGAMERSATGAGVTVGMALGLGPAVVGLDRWYLDEPVTVVRLGLAL